MAAAAAALCTISCNKDVAPEITPQEPIVEVSDDRVDLTVNISGTMTTKSTTITEADEETVKSIQVFIFRGDDLDAYAREDLADDAIEPLTEITVSCTKGQRNVYAFVNAPDLSGILTETELNATVSDLKDNEAGKFVMMNTSLNKEITETTSLPCEVTRLAARVAIKKITRNFTSPSLAAMDFEIDAIYLINVAHSMNYGLTSTPTTFYNDGDYNSGNLPALTYDELGEPLINNSSYSTHVHTFYCYPNSTSDNPTRLVVKTTLWDDANNNDTLDSGEKTYTYYYPITIPSIERNKSYEINELIITRPGATTPDTEIEFAEGCITISVDDWTVVTVKDSEENDFVKI